MKVLVTGAAGFVGRYVVAELVSNGYEVIATSRRKEKAKNYEWFSSVEYIEHDFANTQENYYDFFCRPDLLIHLCWEGLSNYSDHTHVDRYLPRHCNFLRNIICGGLKNVVVTGTCQEYGLQSGELSEALPTNPTTPYGIAKDALYRYCVALCNSDPFRFVWLRLFYNFGEGQSPNSLFGQLDSAIRAKSEVFNMSGGEQLRDFLPIEEVAKRVVHVATLIQVEGVFNVCSGKPISVRRMVEGYLRKANCNIDLNLGFYDYPKYEPMAFWGDCGKLAESSERRTFLKVFFGTYMFAMFRRSFRFYFTISIKM